jgi:hypothetical protein
MFEYKQMLAMKHILINLKRYYEENFKKQTIAFKQD